MVEIPWSVVEAGSVDDIVAALRAAPAYDLSEDGGPPHDLLDHSLQTALVLRRTHPEDVELQIAGLVHDLGHILGPRRDEVHAEVSAAFVRPVLGERVAALVRLHVPAKRYLVTTDPAYGAVLAADSVASLATQGGEMDGAEVAAFEAEPYATDALVLRRADEAGKVAGLPVPGLESWMAVVHSHDARSTSS